MSTKSLAGEAPAAAPSITKQLSRMMSADGMTAGDRKRKEEAEAAKAAPIQEEAAPSVSKQISRMMSSDGKTAGDREREAKAAEAAKKAAAVKKAAAAKAADKPLTPKDIVGVLEARGWEATIVESDDVAGLIDVDPNGILKCVDGRGSDNKKMAGPKMLGGAYAIANNRGISTVEELKGICQEIKAAGHVPSVHGDAGGMLGCGFCKLWLQGKFEDLGCTPPKFTAEEGGAAVKEAGGVVEMHYGAHAEKVVYINFVTDKTLEPNHEDQRFIVDAWAAGKFNLDIPKYLVTAAATVERLGGPKKAVLIVPSPPKPLTPEDIVGVLQARGWEAEIKTASSVEGMIPVDPNGILKCVDGRGSDNKKMAGPKMLGGAYAIANNRGAKTLAELKGICQEIKAAGHVPSVHGDAGGMLGCGFCKLWIQGKFEDLGCTPPNFTAEEGGAAVKEAGGVVEMHYGAHAEKVVYINLVADMTLEPNHEDQRFIVDAWAAGKFNLDIPKYLVTAAATVERLGGPKKAVLIIPDPPLTPEDIVGVLKGRGWEAEIKTDDKIAGMIPVDPNGILKCVDGRGSDNKKMAGPKMLGGAYAIANNRGISTLAELKGICQEIKAAGHVPSVHGDAGGMLGCGFCKLWLQGKFEDLGCTPPKFTAEEGGAAVKEAGGDVEMHYGAHAEKVVYINFVPDRTLEPNHEDQRFIVDAWAAGKFNLDIPKYLVTAAATVERLGGPKKAVLIIPGKKSLKSMSSKKLEVLPPTSSSKKALIGVAAAVVSGAIAAVLNKKGGSAPVPAAPVKGRR